MLDSPVLSAAQAAYDSANAELRAAHERLTAATGYHCARHVGPGWRIAGMIDGAHASRSRTAGGSFRKRDVSLLWRFGESPGWIAWAEHEGRDSDRSGAPDPSTESAAGDTPAAALAALALIADGMASRGRLPRRVADLRHLAQFCRDLADECLPT
jgi:hypothetical protein